MVTMPRQQTNKQTKQNDAKIRYQTMKYNSASALLYPFK